MTFVGLVVVHAYPGLMRSRPRGVRGFDPARLRAVREARRAEAATVGMFTQADMAGRLGIDRVHYNRLEHDRPPVPATFVQLVAVLEVAPHELTTIDPDEATLGDLRQWAGLSQAQAAERLGLSRTHYRAMEQGRYQLTDERIRQLADILGVEASTVVDSWARARALDVAAADHEGGAASST